MSTGLALPDVERLTTAEKRAIANWHRSVSGWDAGPAFLPRVVRDLDPEQRLALATDAELDRAWRERERRRVAGSPFYFVEQYGSVKPEEGPSIPFDLWPEQVEVLRYFHEQLRVVVLKARQLGLTWLALHYGFWRMAFDPASPGFRVLALSKKGSDADELIIRARQLNERLPPFLRQRESMDTRESNSKLKLAGRGSEMRSLMGTAQAARSFTAGLAILDEFAFYPSRAAGPVWTAVNPTLGSRGKAIIVTTGNGRTGNGAALATMWDRASAGTSTFVPVFLPYGVHPDRSPEWRERQAADYLTREDLEAEYPENAEQALAGQGSFHVYSHEGLAAAAKLGLALEARFAELLDEGVEWGVDWGDFQTFAVYAVPLPRGGLYVVDELVLPHTEPGEASEQIIYREPAGVRVRFTYSAADSNPKGTNRTFARVLREAHDLDPERWPPQHQPVPFSQFKEGGRGGKNDVNTVAYLQALLEASARYAGPVDDIAGVLAVHPRCKTLLAQMRNLERDADDVKVRKPALDPRQVEKGDHGADALVALAARKALAWRSAARS